MCHKSLSTFLLLLIQFFFISEVESQDIIYNAKIRLKGNGNAIFIEGKNPEIFLFDSKGITKIDLSDNVSQQQTDLVGFHRKEIVGYSKNKETENSFIYFRNLSGGFEFILLTDEGEYSEKGLLGFVTPYNESHLSSFVQNDILYILTITKKSSIVNFYPFDGITRKDTLIIDLSSQFIGATLYDKLKQSLSTPGSINISKKPYLELVDDVYVSERAKSIEPYKLYVDDSLVYITLDRHDSATKLINISLSDSRWTVIDLAYPKLCFSNSLYEQNNTNSFIKNDNIYQISICSKEIHFSVNKLDGTPIKSWSISDGYKVRSSNNYYGIEFSKEISMKKFIKRISKLDGGLLVNSIEDQVFIIAGGQKLYSSIGGNPAQSSFQEGWMSLTIDNYSFEFLDIGQNTTFDRLEEIREIVSSKGYDLIFEIDNTLHYAYYNSYAKKFLVQKF